MERVVIANAAVLHIAVVNYSGRRKRRRPSSAPILATPHRHGHQVDGDRRIRGDRRRFIAQSNLIGVPRGTRSNHVTDDAIHRTTIHIHIHVNGSIATDVTCE